MHVPNYVPDPLEVPENVTEQPYQDRIAFVRRVAAFHGVSVCLVIAVALSPMPGVSLVAATTFLSMLLVILCLIRIAFRGVRADLMASLFLMPPLLLVCGVTVSSWSRQGFPVWSAGVGLLCALLYTFMCGRDFSFVGQFVLALIVSSALVSVFVILLNLDRSKAGHALAWNGCYLLYYVYDSASLLARRRVGEELASVVDLYRDVLNVFGWVVRVVAHWRKHRIWTPPPKWN